MLANNVSRLFPSNSKVTQSSLDYAWPDRNSSRIKVEIQIIVLFVLQDQNETMGYGPPGNIQISLANGNIMKIPLASINISEEVNKTGIWKQVNYENGKNDRKNAPSTVTM